VTVYCGLVALEAFRTLQLSSAAYISPSAHRKRVLGANAFHFDKYWFIKKLNSVAFVRERTIPTERPPLVGEVSANFYG
jgi:hypothetical protein